jgi:hypothetical protein
MNPLSLLGGLGGGLGGAAGGGPATSAASMGDFNFGGGGKAGERKFYVAVGVGALVVIVLAVVAFKIFRKGK